MKGVGRLEPTLTYPHTRRYRRTDANIVVDVSLMHGPQSTKSQAVIEVIGGGGAYLKIGENCPVGTLVLLRFTLPGDDDSISCQGTVRDNVEGEGAGLEFLGIRPRDRDRLVAFVEGPPEA